MRTRSLASLAISGDGDRWTLIDVSPGLRAQIQNNRQLHPRGSIAAARLRAVELTGGDIDQTAGLL